MVESETRDIATHCRTQIPPAQQLLEAVRHPTKVPHKPVNRLEQFHVVILGRPTRAEQPGDQDPDYREPECQSARA